MKFVSIVLTAILALGSSPAIAQIGSECESAEDCTNKGLEIIFGEDPNPDVAILYLQRATEYNPNLAVAWYNIGIIRDSIGQYDRAIEAYQTAIDIGDRGEWGTVEPVSALHNRGVAEARLGRYRDAIATFERVLDFAPNHENARNNLRWVEAQLAEQEKSFQ